MAGAILSSAWVFFAGRYLPYRDWAGHVGLAAVLAEGAETGADLYFIRSWIPTPYYLFYALTALGTPWLGAEVAAKLTLVLTAGLLTVGAAAWAQSTGRSPRLAGIASLALFGLPLGYGFSSYLLATPFLFLSMAELEYTLNGRRRWLLPVFLALALVGHGLVFLFTAILVAARTFVFVARTRRKLLLLQVPLAALPALILTLPSLLHRLQRPFVSPEFISAKGPPALFTQTPARAHLDTLWSDLLDRGAGAHHHTAALVLIWWALLWLTAWRRPQRSSHGIALAAGLLVLCFFWGPVNLGWPVTFWVVYARAAPLAALALSLLPSPRLDGRWGATLAIAALVPVFHNAWLNHQQVLLFSKQVAGYDQVRAAIPPGRKVLPLTQGPQLWATLGFLHLADGAAYVPVGHVPEELPVHRSNHPSTPYNPQPSELNQGIAVQYDWLVLKGPWLHQRAQELNFQVVLKTGEWLVLRNPKQQEQAQR